MTAPRILDLSLNLPGPYATWTLACHGADVIKLEPPRGDPARHLPTFFERVNSGKRSVVLDLRDPATHPQMRALLEWADVLVEGFRPGVMERLGFGPENVHALAPDLIYCRISAFGQTGPRRLEPGHDLNLQALTGFSHLERVDQRPVATRLPLADLSTSLAVVAAIQTALRNPRDHVVLDLAMGDALLSWTWVWDSLDPGALAGSAADELPRVVRPVTQGPLRRLGRRLRREKLYSMPSYQLYQAADGWLAVGIVDEQHFWTAFAQALGLKRYARLTMGTRTLLGPYLKRRIQRRLKRHPVAHWLTVFKPLNLPISEVRSVERCTHDPQFARVVRGQHVLPPLPFAVPPSRPAPALGEHNALLDSL